MDVAETPEKVTVKAEVPGLDPKEIDISLVGDLLTIKGEKKSEREEKKENYHLVERSYGSFSRALRLPAAVDVDQIDAKYDQGVLTITCPKKEPVKPKANLSTIIPPSRKSGTRAESWPKAFSSLWKGSTVRGKAPRPRCWPRP